MGALLQLERFDRVPLEAPPPVFDQSDLDAAFERGLAEGRHEAEARQAGALCAALSALSGRLDAEREARRGEGAAAVRALAPLIEALLDGIIPAVARARLQAALLEELLRLSAAGPPLGARIRCGPELAAFAAGCLAATGLSGIEIDPMGPEGVAEAELLGGRVTWDVALIAADLRRLVNELTEME